MPAGRPSIYSDELAATICGRLAECESLRSICRDDDMPAISTVMGWLATNATFSQQYARAREVQAESFAEEIIEISDDGTNDWMEKRDADGNVTGVVVDHEHISRSKLRVDTRKWVASKLAPKRYGERVSAELSGPDGAPIETNSVSDVELAKAIASLLSKA